MIAGAFNVRWIRQLSEGEVHEDLSPWEDARQLRANRWPWMIWEKKACFQGVLEEALGTMDVLSKVSLCQKFRQGEKMR